MRLHSDKRCQLALFPFHERIELRVFMKRSDRKTHYSQMANAMPVPVLAGER